jgi:hypothetical protein
VIPFLFFAVAITCAVKGALAMGRGQWTAVLVCVAVGIVAAVGAIQTLPLAVGP